MRTWFPPPKEMPALPGRDTIVVHVRAGDISGNTDLASLDGTHIQLPYWYYSRVLQLTQWQRVAIVTRNRKHETVRKLQKAFHATVHSGTVFRDFEFMRAAWKLVLSASSLCWFAALLGNASEVHYPHVGHFHVNNTNGNRFAVDDDPRWVYHDLKTRSFSLRFPDLHARP